MSTIIGPFAAASEGDVAGMIIGCADLVSKAFLLGGEMAEMYGHANGDPEAVKWGRAFQKVAKEIENMIKFASWGNTFRSLPEGLTTGDSVDRIKEGGKFALDVANEFRDYIGESLAYRIFGPDGKGKELFPPHERKPDGTVGPVMGDSEIVDAYWIEFRRVRVYEEAVDKLNNLGIEKRRDLLVRSLQRDRSGDRAAREKISNEVALLDQKIARKEHYERTVEEAKQKMEDLVTQFGRRPSARD